MAGVFLSYDRRDKARAKAIARALEKAGHDVWWDLHVRGGAQFAKVIEEALNAADAVIVLWSANSIESAWVRDEAAAGRDSGRLVPVQLGGAEAPLGFRQYQNLDFTRWKGRTRSREFEQLLNAIGDLGGSPASTQRQPVDGGGKWFDKHRALLIGLVIIAALTLAAIVATRMVNNKSRVPTVAVVAAEPSASSQALARDLLVKLGRLQAADPNALKITADPGTNGADFIFQVSASTAGARNAASLTMLARDKTLLWSKDFERPGDEYGDLKQQLALTAARVLACATEAVTETDAKLDQQTLKLYLNGCANLADLAWQDFRSIVPIFREVTRRAPRFDGGWARLVETEAFVIGWETVASDSPEGRALAKDIVAARRLNPRMPEAYWAEYMLVGQHDLGKAAEMFERAAKDNADDPKIAGMRVPFLRRVGRLRAAVEDAKRAADHNPLDPGLSAGYIEALTYSGKRDAARQELDKAEKLWPGTRQLVDARFRFHLRYGDPNEALRIARSGINPDFAGSEPFLMARIAPTRENVERAIAVERAGVGQSPRAVGRLVLALAQFGKEELIYPIVESSSARSAIYLSDALFRPELSRFRRNPRFLKGAKNIGLLDYWQKSGKWPDFCFEPELPYDCKQEAKRLAA